MKKYESYKQTEIQSLESCPEYWIINRIKALGSIRYGLGQPPRELENGLPIIRATNIFAGKISSNNLILVDPSDLPYERKPILKEGEIIVVRSGAYTGDSAIIPLEFEGAVSGYDMVFTPDKKLVHSKYIAYCLLSNYVFKDQLVLTSLRAAQPHLNKEELGSTLIAFPFSINEQAAIAQYLDTKTHAIDKKVNFLEKKIGYYKELRKSIINETVTKGLDKSVKLKDSGIDWIGQIPEDWEVKRFKDVVKKYTTGGTPSTSNNVYFNGHNIWITIGDIGESNLISTSSLFLTDEAIKDANIVKTPKGSLLYSFKLSIGKMAFTTVDCYTNEAILSIFPNKNIDLMYYYMMLPTFMMLAATENIYGAKMLNQKLIANAVVLHPPRQEQTDIATYLDHKTQTIDKIVGNIQSQITTLKELRKTLINDVVTGKIKVVE